MNNTTSDLKDFSYILDADKIGQKINKCQECGQDHSFRPNLIGVNTSIESTPVLVAKLLQSEQ